MAMETFLTSIDAVDVVKNLFSVAKKASADRETFEQKLEHATGDGIFKYVLLINVSALEEYVAQTRIQAQQSFRLCRWVAVTGFLLVVAGIVYAFLGPTSAGASRLEPTYIATSAGIISEFISGIFFYLYNRTLVQINRFHDRLIAMQQTSMSLLASSLIQDQGKKDDAKSQLAQKILPVIEVQADHPVAMQRQ